MSDKQEEKRDVPITVTVTDENAFSSSFDDYEPSVTLSVFVYWILPVLVISFASRFLVDPYAGSGFGIGEDNPDLNPRPPVPVPVPVPQPPTSVPTTPVISPSPVRPKKKDVALPPYVADKPSSYIEVVKAIGRRRLKWEDTDASAMDGYGTDDSVFETDGREEIRHETPQTPPPRGASSDPVRNKILEDIEERRNAYKVCRSCSNPLRRFPLLSIVSHRFLA